MRALSHATHCERHLTAAARTARQAKQIGKKLVTHTSAAASDHHLLIVPLIACLIELKITRSTGLSITHVMEQGLLNVAKEAWVFF